MTGDKNYRFASANHGIAGWRPKLVVSYTVPGQEQGASGRGAGHASLAQQPAPEATPPANQVWRSYYHAAGRRVAMRVQDGSTGANQVHYLFADHLGSSTVSYRSDGSQTVTQRYYPWGSVRPGPGNTLPTGYTFTGQLDSGLGLMYYEARFYDGALGRFIQPDTIVPEPGNPQALNRYSYVLNNPLRYTDPTGMFSEDAVYSYILNGECGGSTECAYNIYAQWQSNAEWWQMLMTAQAGDVLFGSFNIGGHPAEEFAFTFGGSGTDVLSGVYSSDLAGNQVAGVLNQATLSDIFAGSASLVSFYAPYEFTWGGLVAFSSGQIVFRGSLVSGTEYLPSYGFSLGGVMDDLGQRTQRVCSIKIHRNGSLLRRQ